MTEKVILKAGKEKAIRNRHHWIFSGAIAHLPPLKKGDMLPVYSAQKQFLGTAYFNQDSNIIGRMISFDETPPQEAIHNNLYLALALRKRLFDERETNGYRLVHGEGDNLPGLIIDRYNDVLVIQIATAGMERCKEWVVSWLVHNLQPKVIYERSESSCRRAEGLEPSVGILFGEDLSPVEIRENGLRFLVDFQNGQKTGFFCDQRQMRQLVRRLARGRKVLNCFAYSGGFTLYALAGGALSVDSVELSKEAITSLKANLEINDFDATKAPCYQEDVFAFLREHTLDYGLVILDPPAFAKKQKDLVSACRGYKEINRLALQKMPPHSLLLTASCSHFVDETLFQQVLFQAAAEAGRNVRLIGRHQLAEDHPTNIYHPENEYIKSLLLYVS